MSSDNLRFYIKEIYESNLIATCMHMQMQQDIVTCGRPVKNECESVKKTIYMSDYGPPVCTRLVYFSYPVSQYHCGLCGAMVTVLACDSIGHVCV